MDILSGIIAAWFVLTEGLSSGRFQPVDATPALNLPAGISYLSVLPRLSFNWRVTAQQSFKYSYKSAATWIKRNEGA